MKKERAVAVTFPLYKKQRQLIRQLAKREKVSQSEIVRRAIEAYAAPWEAMMKRPYP